MTALEQRLANDMADAATYYFKIQECGPKEPDTAYWRVRVKAKALLREAVDHWKLYQKERLQ